MSDYDTDRGDLTKVPYFCLFKIDHHIWPDQSMCWQRLFKITYCAYNNMSMLKFQITINALLSPVKVQCRSCKKRDAYLNAIV